MVLTRWFSRSLVLIALAGSFGMFAQEMVSRVLMAGDQPGAMTSAIGPTWQSAESFYGHHPGVFQQPSVALAESPLIDTIDALTETAEVEEFVAKQSSLPETLDSAESVPVMARSSPEPVLVASVMPTQPAADEPGSTPLVPSQPVDPSPELPERRPPTIPDFGMAQAAELPPPKTGKPELDEPVLPEVYLPPQRPRTRPRPAEIAESAPGPDIAAHPIASPHDASRYLDPAELVRQRGIERGQQLQRRLEARRMMGYHSLRPPVDASPYSSGNPIRPVVIVVPRTVVVQQR